MSNNDKRSHALYPFSFGTNKAGYKQLLKTAGCVLNLSKSPIPFFFYGKLSYLAKYDEIRSLSLSPPEVAADRDRAAALNTVSSCFSCRMS